MSAPNGNPLNGSSLVKRSRPTFKQQSDDVMRNLRDALHLTLDVSDMAVLSTALAEVVTEEIRRSFDRRFADNVRLRYQELLSLRTTSTTPRRKQKQELPPLVPLTPAGRRMYEGDFHINPFAPPNPAEIVDVYGGAQLGRALQDYTLDMLKQAAAKVQQEHPGTKPASKARKDAVIEYIVKYTGQ